MSQPADTWYVRLPDGRVLRAASTHVVRYHLDSGRIPPQSRVRRSPEDEWMTLDWTEEFADLVTDTPPTNRQAAPGLARRVSAAAGLLTPAPGGVADSIDSRRIQTVGLSSLVGELVAALDSTLARSKLIVAGLAGVLGSSILAAAGVVMTHPDFPWPAFLVDYLWAIAGVALGLVAVVTTVLLTQITYVELSMLRPARWVEVRKGVVGYSIRLALAVLVAGGLILGTILLLRWLPGRLAGGEPLGREMTPRLIAAELLSVLALLAEVILWPILVFTLLLGPVVVIEECSFLGALSQWWWLVRRHLGRLFLYESTAFLASIATITFAFPLALAAWGRRNHWGSFDSPTGLGLVILVGLAAAPLIAYLCVAHVFIYLNLRYKYDARG